MYESCLGKNDISYVIKGNGLKRKSDETRKDLLLLEKQVLALEEKKRKLISPFLLLQVKLLSTA